MKKEFFISSGKNNKNAGSWLDRHEIEILVYIAKHRVLNTNQIEQLFLEKQEHINRKSLNKKLSRWCERGLLHCMDPNHLPVKQLSFNYRIDKRAVDYLVREGFLKSNWLDEDIESFSFPKHSDHRTGVQELVLQISLRLRARGFEFESVRPAKLRTEEAERQTSTPIEPDWILRCGGGKTLYLEFDTGKESNEVIKSKIERYYREALEDPDEEFIVLFAVMDTSLNTKGEYNRTGPLRVGNMKQSWFIKDRLPNLSVYVTHLRHSYNLAERCLLDPPIDIDKELNKIQYVLENENPLFKYIFEPIKDDIYLKNQVYAADKAFRLKSDMESYNVLFVIMKEGDVLSLDRLKYLDELMVKQEFKIPIHKIVAVYTSFEQRINDSFSILFSKNVLFGDLETWEAEQESPPKFYKSRTATDMGVASFEE